MKKKLLYGVAAVILVALLAVAGCSNPLTGGREPGLSDEGLVVLRFSDLRAMNIVPEISLDIAYYEVSFTRTGFVPVVLSPVSGDATETEAVRLLPGPWQVTVSAFNAGGTLIGFAEAEVSVAARQTTTVQMAIESLEGNGTLSLTADLSEIELLEPTTISGTLISGASGVETPISMPVNGSSAEFETDLAAGTYLLTLELAEDGTPIASYVNTVLIVYDQTTSAALQFRGVGTLVIVELADEITRPIAITLEGLQPEMGTEQSMTVSALTATEVDSYQWYLDGKELDGELKDTITFVGAELEHREYLLTVVVTKGAIYSAQAGEFSVVSSLVTYTVSYDANGATSGTAPADQSKIQGVDLTLATNSGNLERRGDNFVGWNTAADASGTDYEAGTPYTDEADVTLYAKWSPLYQVGDTGTAGGIVFYDKGEYSDNWRYLEAAPLETEWTNKPWGNTGKRLWAEGTAIGTGEYNTLVIVNAYAGYESGDERIGDSAAVLCWYLEYPNWWFMGWHLPSIDELELMYENLHLQGIGDFASSWYWSSTEYVEEWTGNRAFSVNFDTGDQYIDFKSFEYRVRAVSRF